MDSSLKKPLVLGLVGATASGKTAVSLKVAQTLGCEIVCLDSMQIYKRMDIGTAKPTPQERALVPHHMLDFVEPDAPYSVAEYTVRAREVIADIHHRQRIPLLVGGTGLYLQGLTYPMDYGGLPSDSALRARLNEDLAALGAQKMHDRLAKIDPPSAARLHPNDTRRVIRALEIYELTGIPMSGHRVPTAADAPYDFELYALDWPRDVLHKRINARVCEMVQQGLADEVSALLQSGVPETAQSMQGLGYKEMIPCLQGKITLSQAIEAIQVGTRNYARRQLIWFRRDERIRWLDSSQLHCAADIIIENRRRNDYGC